MNIIHIANFHQAKYGRFYYCTDRKISNGLIRAGHFVYDFSYRDIARYESPIRSHRFGTEKMNRRLLSVCDEVEPELILIGKGELISLATLKFLRERLPKTKIAHWHFDPIHIKREIKYISEQLQYMDMTFLTTGGRDLDTLRTKHSSKVFFFPNPVDPSIESLENHKQDHFNYDVLFCGRDDGRCHRREYLRQLLEKNMDRVRISINGSLGYPLKFGRQYLDLMRQTAMGLNLSDRFNIEYYSSDRIAQLTGHGMCTFSPRVPKHEKLYSEEEIVYFDSQDDLLEKLIYYKQNPDERKRVAEAGWHRAHTDYSATRVARYFLDTIFDGDTSPYHWAGY